MTLKDAPFGRLLQIPSTGDHIYTVKVAQMGNDYGCLMFEPCGDNERETLFFRRCETECRVVSNKRYALVDVEQEESALPEIERCPFCKAACEGRQRLGGFFWVRCIECEYHSPLYKCASDVIEEHNRVACAVREAG